jgi:hypothetical protein
MVVTGSQCVYSASDFARAKILRDHGYNPLVVFHDLDVTVWSHEKESNWIVAPVIANAGFPWPTYIPIIGPIWPGKRIGNPLLHGPFQKLYYKGPKCASALVLRGPSNVLIRDLSREVVEILLLAWKKYVPFLQRLEEIVGDSLFVFPRWNESCVRLIIDEISQNWGIQWTTFSKFPIRLGKFYKIYPHLYWKITPNGRMNTQFYEIEEQLFPKRDMVIPELIASDVSIATSLHLSYKREMIRLLLMMEEQNLLPRFTFRRARWFGVIVRWTKARLIAERLVQWYGKSVPQDEIEKWALFWETNPPAYVRPEDVEGKVVVLY